MPLWAALALALAAFVVRSASRGLDFTPDLPSDAIVLGLLTVVIALVGWLRADDAHRDALMPDDSSMDTKGPES